MSTEVQKRPRRYTEAEIQRALTEVAACSGNTHMAARNLAADETSPSIDQKTLWRWQHDRAEDYARIQQDLLPAITAKAAEQHMALARRQMEGSLVGIERIVSELPHMEHRDLVNAVGKLDIGSGIHTEKAQLLAGLPTQRIAKSSDELLREFEAEGLKLDAIDAEVVSEETLSPSDGGSERAVPA